MPFTFSHPAAVLPLIRTPLPAAALVIGAMAPDLTFFVPLDLPRSASHSLLGGVTLDPVVGIVALAAWWLLLRAPVLDLGPRGLRERMPVRSSAPRTGPVPAALLVLAALLVGIATHLAWDWFTHRDGLASVWAPWRVQVGPLLLTSELQYLSSVVGAAILLLWARVWWRRTPPDAVRRRLAPDAAARASVVALVVLAVVSVAITAGLLAASGFPGGAPTLLFRCAVVPIGVDLAVVVLIAIAWWIWRHRAHPPHPAPAG